VAELADVQDLGSFRLGAPGPNCASGRDTLLYSNVARALLAFTDPFGLCPEDKGGDGKTDGLDDCPEGSEGWKEYQKAQEAERAAEQQCYEQNKFSSAMGALSGSQGVANAVDVAESGSLISVGADVVAMGLKAVRSAVGGTSNPYASGINLVGRPIARAIGRAISGDPAVTGKLVGGVTAVGDKVSPTFLLIAAGTAAYNTATDLQCRVGIIK